MNQALTVLQSGKECLDKVNILAERLGQAEALLEQGYAEFAQALLIVRDNRFWQNEAPSWTEYTKAIQEKYSLGRTQMYHYLKVVETLQGVVSESDLNKMGITKAGVLAGIKNNQLQLPADILAAALEDSTTAKDLRQLEVQTFRNVDEPGEWLDLGFAFYVTSEEKAELLDAVGAAKAEDPVIANDVKASAQNKEVALRFAREFLASYSDSSDTELVPAETDDPPEHQL